jgi:hypothetical protein
MKKYRLLVQEGWNSYEVNQVYNTLSDPELEHDVVSYPSDWELVEDEDVLPEEWYCTVTEDNIKMLDKWRKNVATYWLDGRLDVGHYVLSKHEYDNSYVFTPGITEHSYYSDYKEITTEQFKKLVYEPHFKITMKTVISITDVMKIHSVACSSWRQKIATEYLPRVSQDQTIKFTTQEIEDMFKAATTGQKPILEEIFGKQQEKIDWDKIKTGSVVMIKYTGCHCNGQEEINFNEPVEVVFYNTPHFINYSKNFFKSGGVESYCTFHQNGNYVLYDAGDEIDYITKVIEY